MCMWEVCRGSWDEIGRGIREGLYGENLNENEFKLYHKVWPLVKRKALKMEVGSYHLCGILREKV